MDIHVLVSERIRELREAKGWSLETLANRSSVSRSNISLIERKEISPTIGVLGRLVNALGVSLSSLFVEKADLPSSKSSTYLARCDQMVWVDPGSGYSRRNLSASAWSPVELVEIDMPARGQITQEFLLRHAKVHQQIWVMEGAVEITVGDRCWQLETGDCLTLERSYPISFRNPSCVGARFLIATARQH
jgi:transcriptional regulator with XRE-family HTH domain